MVPYGDGPVKGVLTPRDLSLTIRPVKMCFRVIRLKAGSASRPCPALTHLADSLFFDLLPGRQDLDEDEEDDERQDEEGQGDEEPFETTQGYLIRGEPPE